MKKIFLFAMLFIAFGTALYLTSCGNARADSRAISSMVSWQNSHLSILDALKGIPDAQKMEYLLKNWPTVEADLKREAPRYYPEYFGNNTIDSVVLFFGKGTITANDKDKKMHPVKVDGELLAGFYLKNDSKKPRLFFVRCVNGAIEAVDDDIKLTRMGIASSLKFTIFSGEGVNKYIPSFTESVNILDKYGFRIFEKEKGVAKQITTAEALQLGDSLGWIRVYSPDLKPGTNFDLINQVCTLPDGTQIFPKR